MSGKLEDKIYKEFIDSLANYSLKSHDYLKSIILSKI